MKILIADDEANNQRLMSHILSPLGSCDLVQTGEEAVEAFELAVLEGSPYDLICMDMLMPEMDGDDALREIRIREREWGVPPSDEVVVIMVTGQEKEKLRMFESYYQGGCTGYLVKPITKKALLEKLDEHGLLPEVAAGDGGKEAATVWDEVPFPNLPGFDVTQGLARMGPVTAVTREIYREGLIQFRKDHENDVEKIAQALQSGETARARRLAHGVKGVAAALSAHTLWERARDLELSFAGEAGADRAALIESYAAALGQVMAAIAELETGM